MNNKLKKVIAYTLIFTSLSAIPVYGADKDDFKKVTLEYEDIEDYVKKENLQIKLNDISLDEMEDALDSADDSSDGIRELQQTIYAISDSLNDIISLGDPITSALAQATQFSLELSSSSLDGQSPSSSGQEGQVDLAELGFEQAEENLVNLTQKMFILFHQLNDNIKQLENNRELLVKQLEIAEISFQYGLVAPSTISDLKANIQEFDTNYTALVHQRDALILQLKGLIGLTVNDELKLGEIPMVDRSYISKIDFKKDLEKAIKNSMSIKTKKAELDNNDAGSKTKGYELQLKENEVTLSLTNQYQLLIEKLNTLELSESKLASLNGKLIKEELRYNMGMISLMDFNSVKNEVYTQNNTVASNTSNLFMEIENYKAMINGMI